MLIIISSIQIKQMSVSRDDLLRPIISLISRLNISDRVCSSQKKRHERESLSFKLLLAMKSLASLTLCFMIILGKVLIVDYTIPVNTDLHTIFKAVALVAARIGTADLPVMVGHNVVIHVSLLFTLSP